MSLPPTSQCHQQKIFWIIIWISGSVSHGQDESQDRPELIIVGPQLLRIIKPKLVCQASRQQMAITLSLRKQEMEHSPCTKQKLDHDQQK